MTDAKPAFCPRCGTARSSTARFCKSCGHEFAATRSGTPVPQPRPSWSPEPQPARSVEADPPRPADTSPRATGNGGRASQLRIAVATVVALAVLAGGYVVLRPHGHKSPSPTADSPTANLPASTTSQSSSAEVTTTESATTPTQTSPTQTSAAPPNMSALRVKDGNGVLQIRAVSCGGTGIGNGFLIAPNLVVTAAHVITGHTVVTASTSGRVLRAKVVGADPATDLALIALTTPVAGHVFSLSSKRPSVGDAAALVGFPVTGAEALLQGSVTAIGESGRVGTASLSGLLATDFPVSPELSGAPLLAPDGTVIGVADATTGQISNTGLSLPAATASRLVSSWRHSASPPAAGKCASPRGPANPGHVHVTVAAAPAIVSTLTTYFTAIDSGDFATAYNQLAASQKTFGESEFAKNDATSYDFNVDIGATRPSGATHAIVDVRFTSLQAAAKGGRTHDVCDNWTLTYTMVDTATGWLIQSTAGQHGKTHNAC
jgi:serine protease Do